MGGAIASDEYARFVICREMGWDYHTYDAQPDFFLEEIMIFLRQENEKGRQGFDGAKGGKSKRPQGYSRT